jgi:hypothetical protein
MLLNFIVTYLIFGVLLNYAISELVKFQSYKEDEDSNIDVGHHLVILLWPILFCSFSYFIFLKIKSRLKLINSWY